MTTMHEIVDYIIESAIKRIEWNAMTDTANKMYWISLHYIFGGAY